MIVVYIDYDIGSGHWEYYYYDSKNYITKTSGFETHILAKEHAIDVLKNSIQFLYK